VGLGAALVGAALLGAAVLGATVLGAVLGAVVLGAVLGAPLEVAPPGVPVAVFVGAAVPVPPGENGGGVVDGEPDEQADTDAAATMARAAQHRAVRRKRRRP
jgi:hypothetical protein